MHLVAELVKVRLMFLGVQIKYGKWFLRRVHTHIVIGSVLRDLYVDTRFLNYGIITQYLMLH